MINFILADDNCITTVYSDRSRGITQPLFCFSIPPTSRHLWCEGAESGGRYRPAERPTSQRPADQQNDEDMIAATA